MRLRFWIGLVAVAAIAVGSVVGALVVHAHDRANFERTQHDEAARSARQAQAVAALSVGQLATAAAFFQAEGRFSRHEFDIVTKPLLSRGVLNGDRIHPAGAAAARSRFERAHGFPIIENPRRTVARAGSRPVYFPLTYAADDRNIPPPLGYDVGADPERAPILRRARDTGRAAATPVMRLPAGGTRNERLPPGLPRRRADRDGGRARSRAGRLRRRRVPDPRPGGRRGLGGPE